MAAFFGSVKTLSGCRARLAALVTACAAAGLLGGCRDERRPGLERAEISGRIFWLEPALEDAIRVKGLGGRASIPAEGGMLFGFPQAQQMAFVMRDCPIDIDIAFLDDAGRVVARHEMKAEEPRGAGESDIDYENRLKHYPSRFAARFAVELAGGTLRKLGLREQDLVGLDLAGLKGRAK